MDKKLIDLITNMHRNIYSKEGDTSFITGTLLTCLFAYRHPDLYNQLKNPVKEIVFHINDFGVTSRAYNLSYALEFALDQKNSGISEEVFAGNIVDQLAEELRIIMKDYDVYPYLLFMPFTATDSSYQPKINFKIRAIFVPKEKKDE